MSESLLVWVAVPGGIQGSGAGRVAVLRVLVVPQLQGASITDSGMNLWPSHVAQAELSVEFSRDGSIVDQAVPLPPPVIPVQGTVWHAFFGAQFLNQPFSRTEEDIPQVLVKPTSAEAATVTTAYAAVAGADLARGRIRFDELVNEQLGRIRSDDGFQALGLPDVLGGLVPDPLPTGSGEPDDFHRTVSMLREHPAVLQALGLIFEIRVPASGLPIEGSPAGQVRVSWPGQPGPPALARVVSPWTAFSPAFLPASTQDISEGMVTLTDDRPGAEPDRWRVVTVDVDTAAGRLRNASQMGFRGPGPGGAQTFPALTSAGLVLLRPGRQQDFDNARRSGVENARRGSPADGPPLTADQLVLGYRFDIREQGGPWRSLHQRRAEYWVVDFFGKRFDVALGSDLEEGHLKVRAAAREGANDYRADEIVLRWSGWSLAVDRPKFDGSGVRRSTGGGFRFRFDPEVGSLPRLRFARTYQIRARVADMAGGGLQLDDPRADRCATDRVTYRRYEPIASPVVAFVGPSNPPLDPSDSVAHIVIRSDEGTAAEFLQSNPAYTPHHSRRLFPPGASLPLAEQHGMLDGVDDEQTWQWVKRAQVAGQGGLAAPAEVQFPDPCAGGICAFPVVKPETADMASVERQIVWAEQWPDLAPKDFVLRDPRDLEGNPPSGLFKDGDVFEVRLRPAEQMTLELSTFLKSGFLDHLAVVPLLPPQAENGPPPTDPIVAGRHPLVTPATEVTLLHAVRRPIDAPLGELRLTREPAQTFAVLDPQPPLLGLHAPSTGQLDVTATWIEHRDHQKIPVEDAPVHSFMLSPLDTDLKGALQHEFGDTKYRKVTYTLSAVSRFRRYFLEAHPSAFVKKSSMTLEIPSSARPDPPNVISVYPSFRWHEGSPLEGPEVPEGVGVHQRKRIGGGLRVELAGPWHLSGEDERLAVVVWANEVPDSTGLPPGEPAQERPFISHVGRDPIRVSGNVDPAWPVVTDLSAFPGDAAPAIGTLMLPEAGKHVVAVGFKPWTQKSALEDPFTTGDLDLRTTRWYADILLPAAARASYCPMVQLALARYQPHSLGGLELSQVVKSEIVPLLPDRTLRVSRPAKDTVGVMVIGSGTANPANQVEVVLEHRLRFSGSPAAIDLTAADDEHGPDQAWVGVPGGKVFTGLNVEVFISIPADLLPEPIPDAPFLPSTFRVRVRESETIPTIEGSGLMGERTVYVDLLEVPPPPEKPLI